MMKAAKALSGIRSEDDTHEAALVAALTALEAICEPNGEVSSSPRVALCRCSGNYCSPLFADNTALSNFLGDHV
jgi:hypothetical protein